MSGLTGARNPDWIIELLDDQDRLIGPLDGVSGGSMDWTYQELLGYSGQIEVDGGLEWARHRVRVSYDPGTGDAVQPKGVFVVSEPDETHHLDGRARYQTSMLSKLVLLDRDKITARYSLPEGTVITTAVGDILGRLGHPASVAESSASLVDMMVWEVGTPWLTIINDLLKSAAYEPLWVDETGIFQASPYVAPLSRPAVYRFEDGEAAIHSPEWSRSIDMDAIHNVWVVHGQGSEDDEPLVGIAVNADPEHPYSTVSLGYRNVGVTEGINSEDESLYGPLAEQYLRQSMAQGAKLAATHAIIPVRPGQNVEFVPDGEDLSLVTVQSVSYDFAFDAQCAADWLEATEVVVIDEIEEE